MPEPIIIPEDLRVSNMTIIEVFQSAEPLRETSWIFEQFVPADKESKLYSFTHPRRDIIS